MVKLSSSIRTGKSILLLLMLLFISNVFGQNSERRLGIGGHLGISDYYGDLSTNFFDVGKTARNQGGLTFSYYLTKTFDVAASFTYGAIGYDQEFGPSFGANLFQANAQFRFKFNNGFLLKETAKFQPFIFAGIGLADYANESIFTQVTFNTLAQTDLTFNAGLGTTYMLFENWGINYTLLYAYTNGDQKDGLAGVNKGMDQFMIHSGGIIYLLGQSADTDGDGVIDKKDKCPETPDGVSVDEIGCAIDTDSDGVPDYLDKCPEVKGVEKFQGCSDRDGDGVVDEEDECPEVPGVKSLRGCPDEDGDGITDDEDKCPTIFGVEKFEGCPDNDGDGIPDSEDKCPTIKGTDSNLGCPEISDETKEIFERALKGIQFESGRDVIKTESYGILNDVADIMHNNPDYKLTIDGHTDADGDASKNQILSEKRAAAVMNYLVGKGVSENRLTSRGFGETKPKATNDTAEGRAENRRVEFSVDFASDALQGEKSSTRVVLPEDMINKETNEGLLSGQLIIENKPGEYPANKKISLLDSNGLVIKRSVIDPNGNFEFKHIPTDQDYYLQIEGSEKDLLLMVYNKTGNVKVVLRANVNGVFYDKEITGFISEELTRLNTGNDDFELETSTIWGTLEFEPPVTKSKAGLIVDVYNEAGELIGTAVADENGVFRFVNLPAAETFLFKVRENQTEFELDNLKLSIYDRNKSKVAQLRGGQNDVFTFRPLGYDSSNFIRTIEEDDFNFILKNIVDKSAIIVYFDDNEEAVQSKYLKSLDKIYTFLSDNPDVKVEINAYADNKSSEVYNLLLSERRGEWIVAYFVKQGIDVRRFSISAYGETRLIDQQNDALNRRAEILLY